MTRSRPGGSARWRRRCLITTYLVALAAACAFAFVYGSRIHAADDAEQTRVINEENRAFCEKFGVGPGTTRFAECAEVLKDVRVRHLQRSTFDFIL